MLTIQSSYQKEVVEKLQKADSSSLSANVAIFVEDLSLCEWIRSKVSVCAVPQEAPQERETARQVQVSFTQYKCRSKLHDRTIAHNPAAMLLCRYPLAQGIARHSPTARSSEGEQRGAANSFDAISSSRLTVIELTLHHGLAVSAYLRR